MSARDMCIANALVSRFSLRAFMRISFHQAQNVGAGVSRRSDTTSTTGRGSRRSKQQWKKLSLRETTAALSSVSISKAFLLIQANMTRVCQSVGTLSPGSLAHI